MLSLGGFVSKIAIDPSIAGCSEVSNVNAIRRGAEGCKLNRAHRALVLLLTALVTDMMPWQGWYINVHDRDIIHGDLKGVRLQILLSVFCPLTYFDQPTLPSRFWTPRRYPGHNKAYHLKFIRERWNNKMGEPGAPRSRPVWFEGYSTDGRTRLLRVIDGNTHWPNPLYAV